MAVDKETREWGRFCVDYVRVCQKVSDKRFHALRARADELESLVGLFVELASVALKQQLRKSYECSDGLS